MLPNCRQIHCWPEAEGLTKWPSAALGCGLALAMPARTFYCFFDDAESCAAWAEALAIASQADSQPDLPGSDGRPASSVDRDSAVLDDITEADVESGCVYRILL